VIEFADDVEPRQRRPWHYALTNLAVLATSVVLVLIAMIVILGVFVAIALLWHNIAWGDA
jgi:hypothetical protein